MCWPSRIYDMISSIGQEKHYTLLRWIYKHDLAVLYLLSLLTSLAKDIVTCFFPRHELPYFVVESWCTSKILSLIVGNQTICRWKYAEPSVSFPYLGYNVSSIRASKKWWLPWVRWLECMAREVWRNAPLENAWNSLRLQMSISCLRHTPGWCD